MLKKSMTRSASASGDITDIEGGVASSKALLDPDKFSSTVDPEFDG